MALARVDRLTYWYPGADRPALAGVELEIEAGLTVVAGPSGGGKSTLLRLFNGLVPHFHGGRLAGRAVVAGLDVASTPTRRLAREVGFVFQDPELQTVRGLVAQEVAFGPENLAVPERDLPGRVDEALEAVGMGALRERRVRTLSGGERQRLALAAALAVRPRLVVLDEPTSQLDRDGSRRLVAICRDLARGGRAVVVAEHRLESLLPAARRVVLVEGGRVTVHHDPRAAAAGLPSPPAIVRLGLQLGWSPLPLTPEEAPPLRLRAGGGEPSRSPGPEGWALREVSVGPAGRAVLEGVDLAGGAGEVVVLMGPNGGGKSTLLRLLAGALRPLAGRVERRPGRVAYLPQNPTVLLHRPTVRDEVRFTLERAGDPEPPEVILERLGLLEVAGSYPRDLSTGQRQRAALAAVLPGSPALALLDEPTRGMDGEARAALRALLAELRGRGTAIVLATHDADLAAEVGDRVVRVGEGVARDLGPPALALSGDAEFATQIGQLCPGGPVTVEGVLQRWAAAAPAERAGG
ncbi:MAG TPA: ABC transporter ATP-binding protein [Candidatus Dormibacteraeota bacterium]|nr:ABC transporter ATP-binding protein [Candidatus Dormibacteraeota bacterium]